MRIQENKIEKEIIVHIYLNEQEKNSRKVKEEIRKIREKNRKVIVFISGENNVEETFLKMIKIMKIHQ